MPDYTQPSKTVVTVPAPIVAGLIWLIAGTLLVFAARTYLPDKYFFDNLRLLQLFHQTNLNTDGSFGATAQLYQWMYPLGVPDSIVVGIVNYTVVVLIAVICMLLTPARRGIRDLLWITSWCLMAAVFVGMLSKEFFTILVTAVVLGGILRGGIFGWGIVTAAVIAYATGVRAYWIALLPYTFILTLLIRRKHIGQGVMGFVAMLLIASFSFHILTGFYITDVRMALNLPRLDSPNISSMIMNPMANSSIITDVANQLWAWINFMLPIRLFLSGISQQIAFAAWQIGNMIVVGIAVFRARRWLDPTQFAGIVAFIGALTLILATFDGDFGSYTRHQIALLPIVAFLIASKLPTSSNDETDREIGATAMTHGMLTLAISAAANGVGGKDIHQTRDP